MKLLILSFRFYRQFLIAFSLISLYLTYVLYGDGLQGFVFGIWGKIFSTGMILSFTLRNYRKQFYYYKNLGMRKRTLFVITGMFDIFFFLILFLLASCLL